MHRVVFVATEISKREMYAVLCCWRQRNCAQCVIFVRKSSRLFPAKKGHSDFTHRQHHDRYGVLFLCRKHSTNKHNMLC